MRDNEKMRSLIKDIFLVVLTAAFFVTGVWGYNQYTRRAAAEVNLENIYQEDFYNLMNNVENIKYLSGKARVAATPLQGSYLFAEIKNEAQKAQQNISNLPFEQTILLRTSQYFNQVSDYSASLAKAMNSGDTLSEDDKETLNSIYVEMKDIFDQLSTLEAELAKGSFGFASQPRTTMQEVREVIAGDSADTQNTAFDYFANLDNNLQKIATMNYDGAFSDHMLKLEAKGLTDGEDTNEEKTKELADQFISLLKIDGYQYASSSLINEGAAIPAYLLEYQNGEDSIYMSISKSGGKVVSFFSSRRPDQSQLGLDELREKASKFLESAGYDNLEAIAEKKEDNCFNITYARRDGEILCYPDNIKICLAMDNGDLITLDAKEYWMNHCEREATEAKYLLEDAENGLQSGFQSSSNQLAYICDGCGGEMLCYEFRGMMGEDEYSVYINTEDGGEECILNNCKDENGFYTR